MTYKLVSPEFHLSISWGLEGLGNLGRPWMCACLVRGGSPAHKPITWRKQLENTVCEKNWAMFGQWSSLSSLRYNKVFLSEEEGVGEKDGKCSSNPILILGSRMEALSSMETWGEDGKHPTAQKSFEWVTVMLWASVFPSVNTSLEDKGCEGLPSFQIWLNPMNMERLCSYRFSSWEPAGNLSFNYSVRSWQLNPLQGPRGCSCKDQYGLQPTWLKNERSQSIIQCSVWQKQRGRLVFLSFLHSPYVYQAFTVDFCWEVGWLESTQPRLPSKSLYNKRIKI